LSRVQKEAQEGICQVGWCSACVYKLEVCGWSISRVARIAQLRRTSARGSSSGCNNTHAELHLLHTMSLHGHPHHRRECLRLLDGAQVGVRVFPYEEWTTVVDNVLPSQLETTSYWCVFIVCLPGGTQLCSSFWTFHHPPCFHLLPSPHRFLQGVSGRLATLVIKVPTASGRIIMRPGVPTAARGAASERVAATR